MNRVTAWKQAYYEMFPMAYPDEDTPQTRTNEFLEACNNNGINYHIIYEDAMAVGIVKVVFEVNKVCEISGFYILEEYRNRGYGRQVIAYMSDVLVTDRKIDGKSRKSEMNRGHNNRH